MGKRARPKRSIRIDQVKIWVAPGADTTKLSVDIGKALRDWLNSSLPTPPGVA